MIGKLIEVCGKLHFRGISLSEKHCIFKPGLIKVNHLFFAKAFTYWTTSNQIDLLLAEAYVLKYIGRILSYYTKILILQYIYDINILKRGFGSRMMKVILVIAYIQRNIQTINFPKNACNHAKEKIFSINLGIPIAVRLVPNGIRLGPLRSFHWLFRPASKSDF